MLPFKPLKIDQIVAKKDGSPMLVLISQLAPQKGAVLEKVVKSILNEAHEALTAFMNNAEQVKKVAQAGELLANTFKNKKRVYSCGNGGSMCDAMHFAEELSGRFRDDRPGLAATAISDPSHLSCVGNDYGYDSVFSRYIAAHGQNDDVMLAISTSGTSKNVLKACEQARSQGVKIIALTGRDSCPIGDLADIHITAKAGKYADRVQEIHIKIIHSLIELVERHLYPENYKG